MRFWRDKDWNVLTDEQVLRHIATFGSISAALEYGDIELISDTGEEYRPKGRRTSRPRRLSDYLSDHLGGEG